MERGRAVSIGNINDIDTTDSPAQYVARLERDNKQLRAELIKARHDFDEAMLVVARLSLDKQKLIDVLVEIEKKDQAISRVLGQYDNAITVF